MNPYSRTSSKYKEPCPICASVLRMILDYDSDGVVEKISIKCDAHGDVKSPLWFSRNPFALNQSHQHEYTEAQVGRKFK